MKKRDALFLVILIVKENTMKRYFLLFLMVFCVLCFSGCSQKTSDETVAKENGKLEQLSYQIDPEYSKTSRSITSGESISYSYDGFLIGFSCRALEPNESLEDIMNSASELDAQNPDDIIESETKNVKVAGLNGKELFYKLKLDSHIDPEDKTEALISYDTITGFTKDNRAYLIRHSCMQDATYQKSIGAYKEVLDSVKLEESAAPPLGTKNIGTYDNVTFTLKNWNVRSEDKNGRVVYSTREGINIFFLPVDSVPITQDGITTVVAALYEAEPETLGSLKVKERSPLSTNLGAGETITVQVGEQALSFAIVNQEDKKSGFALFMEPADPDLYKTLLASLKPLE